MAAHKAGLKFQQKSKQPICYLLDAVGSSGILKGKQKLGVTFNSDKLGGIDFTKISKLRMCSAGAGRYWLVLVKGTGKFCKINAA